MTALLSILATVFWLAVALGILVFIHELGHFLTARLFGMRVDAFSLGMPPNVFRKQVGDTEYRLGALPLGGYVKIAGMVDESLDVPYEMEPVLDSRGEPVLDDEGEPLYTETLDARGKPIPTESEPQPDEFRAKPVWQRLIVISAGVVFNVILAFAIYSALAFTYGQRTTPAENVPIAVAEASIAEDIGLRTGDRIVAIGDQPLEAFESLLPRLIGTSAETVTVLRDGQEVAVDLPDGLLTRLSREARASGEDSGRLAFGATEDYPPVIGGVQPGGAADDAGLRAGDRIIAISGARVERWSDLTGLIGASEGREIPVRWVRPDSLVRDGDPEPSDRTAAGAVYQVEIAPRAVGDRYLVGIEPDPETLGSEYRRLGFGDALSAGADETVSVLQSYVGFFGKLISGRESFRENVGGPIVIAQQSKQMADRGGPAFWAFVAYLSIALAVFNILPIPALDGGHIVFLLYEAVARREPSLKVRMVVQQVGLALILMLMVFVIFNDALRLFG